MRKYIIGYFDSQFFGCKKKNVLINIQTSQTNKGST